MLSLLSSLGSDYFINQSSGGTQLTGIALLLSQANVWCDATDATTIFNNSTQLTTPGTSAFLTRWVNKNNTSRSFLTTSSPRWNNTFNTSYRGIQNTGNTLMYYSDPATLPFNSYSIFIVSNTSSDGPNAFCGIGSATTNGNNAQMVNAFGANVYVFNGANVAVQEYATGFNSSPYGSTAISTRPFIFEYIKTQGTNEGYYTGTSMNYIDNDNVSTGSAQQTFCSLFCHSNSASNQPLPANSYIAEVLIFPTALNTTDRQMVEGYLAGKFNLRSFLPTNHPYKNSSPA